MAGRSWYYDIEDDLEERNEAMGRAFVSDLNQEKKPVIKTDDALKLFEYKDGQLSMFEEPISYKVGTTRGYEYIQYAKREDPVKVMGYAEEYIPEIENE